MRAHGVAVHDYARRRIRQTQRDANVLHLFTQRLLDLLDQVLELVGDLLFVFLFLRVCESAKVEIALGDRGERLALEFVQELQHPFVDPVSE